MESTKLPVDHPRLPEIYAEMRRIYEAALESTDPEWKALLGNAGHIFGGTPRPVCRSGRAALTARKQGAPRAAAAEDSGFQVRVRRKSGPPFPSCARWAALTALHEGHLDRRLAASIGRFYRGEGLALGAFLAIFSWSCSRARQGEFYGRGRCDKPSSQPV